MKKTYRFLRWWIIASLLAFLVVIFVPPIAIGLVTIPVVEQFHSPEAKLFAGFTAGLVAFWMAWNFAELLVLLSTIQVSRLMHRWLELYRRRLAPVVVES